MAKPRRGRTAATTPSRGTRPAKGPVKLRASRTATKPRDPSPARKRTAPASRRGAGTLGTQAVSPVEHSADRSSAAERIGRYVYCVIEATKPLTFGRIGIGNDPSDVYTVRHKSLAAVVSDVALGGLDSTRDNVLAHERVNARVMRDHTVIPMSFGSVFKTHDDIEKLLSSAGGAFDDVLRKMENKLEFGLKVLWDRDRAVRDIEAEDEDIRLVKQEISGQKGSTYFARMQYGRMVDAALQMRSDRFVQDILAALRDVCVASRVNKAIGDNMILNAAFLISRKDESAFDARVKGIGSRLDALTFKYTGPWPPYNFVNIRLKLERA